MYHIKVAFALVQVGTNLWVNPMQINSVRPALHPMTPDCTTIISADDVFCTDWTLEQVREALKPAAVAKALEGK